MQKPHKHTHTTKILKFRSNGIQNYCWQKMRILFFKLKPKPKWMEMFYNKNKTKTKPKKKKKKKTIQITENIKKLRWKHWECRAFEKLIKFTIFECGILSFPNGVNPLTDWKFSWTTLVVSILNFGWLKEIKNNIN